MKISRIKLANAIKIGQDEKLFLLDSEFDINLDGVIVKVVSKRSKDSVFTSLYNAIYWVADESKGSTDSVLPGTPKKIGKA